MAEFEYKSKLVMQRRRYGRPRLLFDLIWSDRNLILRGLAALRDAETERAALFHNIANDRISRGSALGPIRHDVKVAEYHEKNIIEIDALAALFADYENKDGAIDSMYCPIPKNAGV